MTNEIEDIVRFRRLINLNEDWFTGAMVFSLIRRNEHFRAITV